MSPPRRNRGAGPARQGIMKKRLSPQMSSPKEPCKIIRVRPDILGFCPPDGGVVYLVRTSKGLILVDTSFLRHRHAILKSMRNQGIDPRQISLGFVTHFHADHVGGMGWWRKHFGFPVVAHKMAVEAMSKPDRIATGALMPYTGLDEDFAKCPIDYQVSGGETIAHCGCLFKIIYAPGHSASSMHILFSDRIIFVGDTIFANGGLGWMDVHWGSNPEDYVETLERLRKFVGWLALPAHGTPFVLSRRLISKAQKTAAFYIPYEHGMGCPRPPSHYRHLRAKSRPV